MILSSFKVDGCNDVSNKNSNPEDFAESSGSLGGNQVLISSFICRKNFHLNNLVIFLLITITLLLYIYVRMAATFLREKSTLATNTDVLKTFSGRLKKVKSSYDQTGRSHDVWEKSSDLRRLEDA